MQTPRTLPRKGRTARAGSVGRVFTLVTDTELRPNELGVGLGLGCFVSRCIAFYPDSDPDSDSDPYSYPDHDPYSYSNLDSDPSLPLTL